MPLRPAVVHEPLRAAHLRVSHALPTVSTPPLRSQSHLRDAHRTHSRTHSPTTKIASSNVPTIALGMPTIRTVADAHERCEDEGADERDGLSLQVADAPDLANLHIDLLAVGVPAGRRHRAVHGLNASQRCGRAR
eukprot:1055140-Prymnesium_polylepis.1